MASKRLRCGICGKSHHTFYFPTGRIGDVPNLHGKWSQRHKLPFPVCFSCYIKGSAYVEEFGGLTIYKWDIIQVRKPSKATKQVKVLASYQEQYGKVPTTVYLQKA